MTKCSLNNQNDQNASRIHKIPLKPPPKKKKKKTTKTCKIIQITLET